MSKTLATLRREREESMATVPRNQRFIMGGMVALAALIFAVDSQMPQGWAPAPLYIAVVGASMWLAGLQPIWIAAIACALLTVLAFFVSPPGWINADLFNRGCSILAIWVVALFCVLYKRAERRSLELASIVKSFGDAIISKSLDGVITTWNAGAEKLFGYTAEEVLGRPVTLLFAPEHRDEESRILEVINRGEQITHFETERARKDGSRVPVSLSVSPVVDAGGKVVGVATIASDITERRRTAEEMQQRVRESAEAEERMRSVVNHVADGIITIDDLGTVTTFNPAAERIFGYAAQEVIGQNIKMVMPEPYHSQHDGYLGNYLRTGQAKIIGIGREVVGRRKDGFTFPLDLAVNMFRLGQGRYFTGIVRDITERKRAEEALRESEERFRGTFENAAVGIAHEDLAGRFMRFNKRFCEILGYSPSELVGKTLSEVTYPEDLADDLAKFDALTRGESSRYAMEKRFIRKDGALVWAHVTVSLQVEAPGKPNYCIKIIQDVSDRKRLDEELQQAKEAAETASRAKSEFLASMSHEIRTPMNGVFGMLDLALDTDLEPEQRHYLERARSSADLLLRVINDILDFSKIEAGRLDLEPAAFSLRECLGEAIKAFGPRAHRKELELALHVRPDTPDGVVGDALRLGQVLTNLLGNAIKFTDRGEVVLKVGVESVTEAQLCLHFAVTDTGPGIPPDKQSVIFGAFAQADSSMARRFGGTGLGLAISARLVELMGGRIWVESVVGKGSTFHFTACFGVQHEAVATQKAKEVDLEGLPVLVADDNETNQGILAEMLANWGIRPTAVGSGRAALAELKRAAGAGDPFPLVLLDAVMPDLDGFAVAQEIRHDPALAGAMILMLSSADQGGELARCRELGIAAYLRKPIKQSELLNAVLTALGSLLAGPETAPAPTGSPALGIPPGLRILVAEDNQFNQELVASLLKKRGHVPVLAGDGKAALTAWEKEPFDLILMDVQMPEMDGFAATKAIRAKESAANTHVPIVALTAHAMKGDRERCLAAGMDAYVSKPIRTAEFFETIARLLHSHVEGAKGMPAPEGQPGAVFDLDTALAGAEGDRELLKWMVHVFCRQCPKLLEEIRDSVLCGDGAALERGAHKLKASVGQFGAQRASQAAARLEELGGAGDVTGFQQAYPELEEAVRHLQAALADLVREGGTGGP
jgi:two-component system, sensor histidine kinase and response regulator